MFVVDDEEEQIFSVVVESRVYECDEAITRRMQTMRMTNFVWVDSDVTKIGYSL